MPEFCIPKKPYTDAEIEAYVKINLQFVGAQALKNSEALQQDFVQIVKQLPAWQQILLIEYKGHNLVGNITQINALSRDKGEQDTAGFFRKEDSSSLGGSNTAVWKVSKGKHSTTTFRHEEGHRLDYLLGRPTAEEISEDYSDEYINFSARPAWQNALIWHKITDTEAPVTAQKSLYEGYIELKKHLSYYKESQDHYGEALAEMECHYASLYAKHEGDIKLINKILGDAYPTLWPIFRDEFIPLGQQRAEELYELRQNTIEEHVSSSRLCAEKEGAPYDEKIAREKAGQRAAEKNGLKHLEAEITILKAKLAHYDQPIADYVEAQRNLHAVSPSNPRNGPFDEAAMHAKAKEILQRDGFHALVEAAHVIEKEMHLLQEFIRNEKCIDNELNFLQAMNIAARKKQDASSMEAANRMVQNMLDLDANSSESQKHIQKFYEIKASSGLEPIQRQISALPIDSLKPRSSPEARKKIKDYKQAKDDLAKTRQKWSLFFLSNFQDRLNPEKAASDTAEEIKNIVRADGAKALEEATKQLVRESIVFDEFYSLNLDIVRHKRKVDHRVNFKESLKDVPERFEAIKKEGGLDAVEKEIERLFQELPQKESTKLNDEILNKLLRKIYDDKSTKPSRN